MPRHNERPTPGAQSLKTRRTARRLSAILLVVLSLAACDGPVLPRQISESGSGAYEASLAALDDGYVVAWHDYRDGNAEVYVRRLDLTGRPMGGEQRLTRSPALSFEADVEVIGGDIVVAWYDRPAEGPLEAKVGRWTVDGHQLWERVLSSPDRNGRNPVVVSTDEGLFCAWIEEVEGGTEVWARWFNSEGRAMRERQRVALAGQNTWNLNGDSDGDGVVWLVFDGAVETTTDELFLARVDTGRPAELPRVVRLPDDDGFASKYPDIALGQGQEQPVALTWFDERDGNREVYLALLTESVLAAGQLDIGGARVTDTPGESIGAYVAWGAAGVGLAWSDELNTQHEIFFQLFDADGRALADPRQLTVNDTASLIPAIEPTADGFALVWNEDVIAERGSHETGGRSEIVFADIR